MAARRVQHLEESSRHPERYEHQIGELKIPRCNTCNNQFLSSTENRVGTAYAGGYEAFCALDRDVLFLSLATLRTDWWCTTCTSRWTVGIVTEVRLWNQTFLAQFRMRHLPSAACH